MLRLLHLSDIHFSRRSGTHYDLDEHTRDLLVSDLKNELQKGAFTGCVITGDIAYSGSEIEYTKASEFLSTLSKELNFPLGSIWIVPGNHDYNRKIAVDSKTLRDLTVKLRNIAATEINREIEEYSTSSEHKEKLYSPLAAYNEFAKQFNCDISSEKSYWDFQIPFDGNPDIFLYIRGLNSVIISSAEDDDQNDNTRMVMSLRQCQLKPVQNGIKISLNHHPFSWLRNARELQTELGNSFNIQLFGHEHEPRVDTINGSIHIHAGAVHPEKNNGASVPCYNILEFSVHQDEKNDIIKLKPISKSYDFKDGRFKTIEQRQGPDHRYEFPIPKRISDQKSVVQNQHIQEQKNTPLTSLNTMQEIRTLQVRFYGLSFYQQFEILQNLKIAEDSDSELLENKKFGLFFQRAKDKKLLKKMWDLVEAKRPVGEKTSNPFTQE